MILPNIPRPTLEPRAITAALRATPPVSPPPGPWTLDLDFRRDEMDPRLQITAPGPKTYWDADAILRVAPPGGWPIEWGPLSHARHGRSDWEGKTNYLLRSGRIDLAPWVVGSANAGIDPLSAPPPDGTTNGARLWSNTSFGPHYQNIVGLSGTPSVCASMFVKNDVSNSVSMLISGDNATTLHGRVVFNLDTLTWQSFNSTNLIGAGIEDVGNDWRRVWLAAQFTSITTPRVYLYPGVYNAGVAKSVFVWGAQVELGTQPGPYIPTEGAAVTRPAERAEMPVGDWYNHRAGMWLLDYTQPVNAQSSTVFVIHAGNANRMDLRRTSGTGNLVLATFSANAIGANLNVNGLVSPAGQRTRIAIRYDYGTGTVSASANGSAVVSAGPGLPPPAIPYSTVCYGSSAAGNEQSGILFERERYRADLPSNAEMQSLSSI